MKGSSPPPEGCEFREDRAQKVCDFFERHLIHVKGRWTGQPFQLLPWQREIVRVVFGWIRPDGTRLYRTVYIEVPRKNGKSTFAAGLALYLLTADGEWGAEVYSAASDREQAGIVYDMARSMAEASPELDQRLRMFRRSMVYRAAGSSYHVLSADAYRHHGKNSHGVIFDELHAQPNRELWDVLKTSTGSRTQPLVIAITTAGYDQNSICWELHEYTRKVIEGVIEDPTFYGVIYGSEKEDDWRDPEVWARANPSLDVTVTEEFLKEECALATSSPAFQNTFRRLYLNQWTAQRDRWLDLEAWDGCGGAVPAEALEGMRCYAGLDLASTIDVAALVLIFRHEDADEPFDILPFFWVPEESVRDRVLRDGVPYDAWIRDGWIEATEGNVIDYRAILGKIEELNTRYQIAEIAFDRWGAQAISNELMDRGFTVTAFGQGMASMNPPTKELLRLVLGGRLRHGGNPVLRWMADNLVVRQDPAGNVKPDKEKSSEKIDGMVALIMGLDRAIRAGAKPARSVYEERGFDSL